MNTTARNFWWDILLAGLLGLVVATPLVEVFSFLPIHTLLGWLLGGVVLAHLLWHRAWIGNAVRRYHSLPPAARTNALLNAALFAAYSLALIHALGAKLALLGPFHLHILFGWVHAFYGVTVVALQVIHLARHWKWITATARRAFRAPAAPAG